MKTDCNCGSHSLKIKGANVTFHVTDISPVDALFIGQVISLLCCPKNAKNAAIFKGGHTAIGIDPRTGSVRELVLLQKN